MDLKVLHITNWYPSPTASFTALWIKRHIDSLPTEVNNTIYHIEILKGHLAFKKQVDREVKRIIFHLPFQIWIINELIYLFLLVYILFFLEKLKNYHCINFHIAYPILTYFNLISGFIKIPVFVIEHWSAYHFNFGVKGRLNRIIKIFNNNFIWLTVSEALANDLQHFSGRKIQYRVLPNVVSDNFYYQEKYKFNEEQRVFFMVSQWKEPKNPIMVFNCFRNMEKQYPGIKLRVGGYGPLEKDMLDYIKENRLETKIEYLGKLSEKEIADELNSADAFIHSSFYETFSVVCAEAASCGCPVIAPEVGGIPEFINSSNGILYDPLHCISLENALLKIINKTVKFDRCQIAASSVQFHGREVGKLYHKYILEIVNRGNDILR